MLGIIITFLIMVICWGIFIFSFKKDRSRYRNCYLLFIALLSGIPFLMNVTGKYYKPVILLIAYLIILGTFVTPYFLIQNGFVMMKKEGKRINHLLSLLLGVIGLLGEIAFACNFIASISARDLESSIRLHRSLPYILSMMIVVTIVYVSMSVLIFTMYIVFLQLIPSNKSFDYVIILGAGLIDGDRVSKILADRIDKALEIYKRSNRKTVLLPSGGKGADESISEAEAIKRYLIDRGVPESDIVIEDRSTTTYENLANSKKIIDNREGGKEAVLVSSNYHVYRALRLCRKIGFKCSGVGGHTTFYFWPSAVLREYIAVHAEKKQAVMFVAGWVICMILTIAFLLGYGS